LPLENPMHGIFDDLRKILEDYDWETNLRIPVGTGTRAVEPKVFIHYEVAGKQIPDNAIVIQPGIVRGIEANGPRARLSLTCNCFSKSAEVAFRLTDSVWNALFAESDSDGTRWFLSGQLKTGKKFPPISTSTYSSLQKSDSESGFWMGIIYLEAETQQSNTN